MARASMTTATGQPETADQPASSEDRTEMPKATRGGHVPTGTSAGRRAKSATRANGKGERTRRGIVTAAREVFERLGYLEARVSDIVAEAGVAHGSYYTYFPSKREVFQEIFLEVGQQITAAVTHGPEDVPGDTMANLDRANRRYLRVYRENAQILTLADQVATIDPVIHEVRLQGRSRHVARVTETIRRLQEHGKADAAVDAHTTAGALVAMLSSFAYWSSVTPGEYDEEASAQAVTAIWARAIGLRETRTRP
jgi:AcrR family transcriptional regulator